MIIANVQNRIKYCKKTPICPERNECVPVIVHRLASAEQQGNILNVNSNNYIKLSIFEYSQLLRHHSTGHI